MPQDVIKMNFTVSPLQAATDDAKPTIQALPNLENSIYETELIEIVEINKTTGEITKGKTKVSLKQGRNILLDRIVTKLLSSDSPTIAVKMYGINNNIQFELSVEKTSSIDTNEYDVIINFFLKVSK